MSDEMHPAAQRAVFHAFVQHHKAGMVLDLSELPDDVDAFSFEKNRNGSWTAILTRYDPYESPEEGGRGSTPSEAFHAALDAWRKR